MTASYANSARSGFGETFFGCRRERRSYGPSARISILTRMTCLRGPKSALVVLISFLPRGFQVRSFGQEEH